MTEDTEPVKGFTCTCGRYERFSGYVYAHWRDVLNFTCPDCKKKWEVICGDAQPYDSAE